eukprot:11167475-Lingulodinium_polyedra.AAC.1
MSKVPMIKAKRKLWEDLRQQSDVFIARRSAKGIRVYPHVRNEKGLEAVSPPSTDVGQAGELILQEEYDV